MMSILTKSTLCNKLDMPEHAYRHEIKYETDRHKALRLKHRLEPFMNSDENSDDYGGYSVNSIYFETPYNKDYTDKELGVFQRQKLRLRAYGNNKIYKLEAKSKMGDVATKYTVSLDENRARQVLAGDFSPLLDINTADSLYLYYQCKTNRYRPLINISYYRYAYYFKSRGFRITFDTDLRWASASDAFFANNSADKPITDKTIIEIKYDSFVPKWLTSKMSRLGINAVSSSKYTSALEHIFW